MSWTAKKKQSKNSPKKFKPHGYQKKGIKFLLKRHCGGLFWKPGLGKTATVLSVFKKLFEEGTVDALYVIAPLRVAASVWEEECAQWGDFNDMKCVFLHGPKKGELIKKEAHIYTINPEGLEWLSLQKKYIHGNAMLVVDESTKFKTTNTKRFKTLKKMLSWFDYRYILTGSPVANGYLNLFGQVYILDSGRSLGAYITHFRNKYFYPSGFGGYDWKLKEGGEEEIEEAISSLVLHMDAKDYLELPELIVKNIKLKLPPKVRKIYKEVEKEFIHDLKHGKVVAANAAVAGSKCRQIANGGVYLTEGTKEFENLHDQKIKAVEEIVEELNGAPALIAYDTHHDLARLRDLLGKDTPYIGAGVSVTRAKEIQASWNNKELPVLLAHPQSIAHGLNLQKGGKAIIWHSLPWSLEYYEQYYQRVYRQGVDGHVFMYHLIMEDTVDEVVYYALQHKDKTQKKFFERLKENYK